MIEEMTKETTRMLIKMIIDFILFLFMVILISLHSQRSLKLIFILYTIIGNLVN